MRILTLDFETKDTGIKTKKGAGWVYADFKILGAGYKVGNSPTIFTTNMSELITEINKADTIIAHNAQYELGCLFFLNAFPKEKLIIDTQILAKLYDNTYRSYSLDALANSFFGEKKETAALDSVAQDFGIRNPMANIDLIFEAAPHIVEQYCKTDVDLTYKLYNYFIADIYPDALKLLPMFSSLLKGMTIWRAKGVRIDHLSIEKHILAMQVLEAEALEKFNTFCPNVNINSPKQLTEAFKSLGLEMDGSVDAKWRKTQSHPAVKSLEEAKKYNKLISFIKGIEERIENGRLYPEINILGATETGRTTSSNPNIQQIPKRHELASTYIRSLFLPEENEQWASLDFSSQEPRIQVHYGAAIKDRSAIILAEGYKKDPKFDMHAAVAKMAGISRNEAKTLNLGLSYGMGEEKLAASLGVSKSEARLIKKKYNSMVPYLKVLSKAVEDSAREKGYIKTILGRRLAFDSEAPYKSLNKLIQGSAADQTMLCLAKAYEANLPVMFSIHDSIEMSVPDILTAERMRDIMISSLNMFVPSNTEVILGNTWGDC
ncbi:MAG: hypothetical protein C0446_08430 [Chitinophaga sp.]|nr:hypothetical protein [Chitinophaga sp.]